MRINRRKFVVTVLSVVIIPIDVSNGEVHMRVHSSRLAEVLRMARESFHGYGVEVLDQDWCNVYIYSGPSPTKPIISTKDCN